MTFCPVTFGQLNDFWSTFCCLILWNGFWQISLKSSVVATMGFQHWTQDQNCDIKHFCTFLLTMTFHLALPLELSSCLDDLAHILTTIKMKTCHPTILETGKFYIGFNGHVPDEYFSDYFSGIEKKMIIPKLHNIHTMVICKVACVQ